MSTKLALVQTLPLTLLACQSTAEVVAADEAVRAPLFDAVKSLEGRWEGTGEDGMQLVHEFQVTSNGSVVRELMFPGTPHEMTNMYALDGNSLAMTHYCAAGNQPRMRASAKEGNRIAFHAAGVEDLKSKDDLYMGAMTLVFVDADHIEQHWTAWRGGKVDHSPAFELHRVR